MARAADSAHDLASLRFELAGRWPAFASLVERSYLAAVAGGAGSLNDWNGRVALASIPILVDARMVAHRRRDRGALDRVDGLLAALLAERAD
jgi:hypothetical protein